MWVGGLVAAVLLCGAAVVTLAPQPRPAVPPSTAAATVPKRGAPVLVWTPGGLPPGLSAAARSTPGVRRVAEVAGDFAWLDAWGPAGDQASASPAGMGIPVDVAAVDLPRFLPFVAAPDADVLAGLDAGSIVLSRTGAALRGIGPGGWVRFGQTTLTVRGVVDDVAIGGHEAAVTRQAGAAIGVVQPRYLLVGLAPNTGTKGMEAALRSSLPAGAPLRVRVPDASTVLREGEVTLTPGAIKLVFGEFAASRGRGGALNLDPAWVARNIQEQMLPIVGPAKCHKAIFPQLQAAFRELVDRGLSDVVHGADFGGCWFPRFLNWDSEAGISHHTWGLAVDLNVSENPYATPGRMDPRVVEVFERWGFEWGGRWLVPDPMHFEFVRFVPQNG